MGLADSSLEFAAIDHRGDDAPWKVLIADDEPEIHDVTRLVLGNFEFAARPLEFLSAYSAAEARELLRRNPDTAVLLLDVVMESEQAGLGLVRSIRGELGNPFVRIVLRTGQAGQAPENEVIAAYDDVDVARLLEDAGIVRNRRKIEATIVNARATVDLREAGGLETLVLEHAPAVAPAPAAAEEWLASSAESVALAKALKKRGFVFVGPTTMYALMQAIGIFDPHLTGCFRRGAVPSR